MIRYIARRVLRGLLSLVLIVTLVFLLERLMPIEGYFSTDYINMSELQVKNELARLGLDKPVFEQLTQYWSKLLKGDIGVTQRYLRGTPIMQLLAMKVPVSLRFGLTSMLISLPLGILLGIFMSKKKYPILRASGHVFVILMQAVPTMIYYLLIQYYGSDFLSVLPYYQRGMIETAILPVICLCLPSIAGYAFIVQRFLSDQQTSEYVMAAKARGLGSGCIEWHMLRNALLPVMQQFPSSVLGTLSGSLYVEKLFGIPGMGGLLIEAISAQDNALISGLCLVFGCISILGMVLGDLLVMLTDPHLRASRKG